jgi:hypothetical protein
MRHFFSILIYLGLISVGIMVLGGVYGVESNKEAIQIELQQIAAHASVFYTSKPEMGGGNGRFIWKDNGRSYHLPESMLITQHAIYNLLNIEEEEITVQARSRNPLVGEMSVKIDGKGQVSGLGLSAGSL